jgi:hypothetical protein
MWHGEEGREVRSRSNQVENGGAALTVKGRWWWCSDAVCAKTDELRCQGLDKRR